MTAIKINVHPRIQLRTTGVATTGNVVPSLQIGTINGLLKANGAGAISRAVPLTDYMLPYNLFQVVMWEENHQYTANTVVSVDLGDVVYYCICKNAHLSTNSFTEDIQYWSLLSIFQRPTDPPVVEDDFPAQVIEYSETPVHDWFAGKNAVIMLTGNVTTYRFLNLQDGGNGEIVVIQDEVGGWSIAEIVRADLTVKYTDALVINPAPNEHTVISYKRIGDVLYVKTESYDYTAEPL